MDRGSSLIVGINGNRAHIWHWIEDDDNDEEGARWATVWDFKQHKYISWYFTNAQMESLAQFVSAIVILIGTPRSFAYLCLLGCS